MQGLPQLPPDYHRAVDRGLAELRLEITPEARATIDGHVRLLLAWTSAINLTAIRDPAAVGLRHVVDSLTALGLLRAWGAGDLLDLGSGGGFPGIPLLAALPSTRGVLVESTGKKASFLRAATEATGLSERVSVEGVRAETLATEPPGRRWSVITARAVGSLADLVEVGFPLLESRGRLVTWKRGDIAAELAAGERALRRLGAGALLTHPVAVDGLEGHVLVVAEKRPS